MAPRETEQWKVGVIIPTCNRVAMLGEAICSVLDQTYTNLEIIVLDDCSSDSTADYLASLDDPRVRYEVNEENLQLARNITKGVALLSRDVRWCTVLCDDDLLEARCIEAFVRTAREKRAMTVVHSHMHFVDGQGCFTHAARSAPDEERAVEFVVARATFVRDRYLSGIFFSRDCFDAIGGYPCFASGMAADDAFVFALALHDRLVYAPDALVMIRCHEHAESMQIDRIEQHLPALREYYHFCTRYGAESGLLDSDEFSRLEYHARSFARDLNEHIWVSCMRASLYDNGAAARQKRRVLYTFGADHSYLFPFFVRLASYCGLLTGICLERSGRYVRWTRRIREYLRKR